MIVPLSLDSFLTYFLITEEPTIYAAVSRSQDDAELVSAPSPTQSAIHIENFVQNDAELVSAPSLIAPLFEEPTSASVPTPTSNILESHNDADHEMVVAAFVHESGELNGFYDILSDTRLTRFIVVQVMLGPPSTTLSLRPRGLPLSKITRWLPLFLLLRPLLLRMTKVRFSFSLVILLVLSNSH